MALIEQLLAGIVTRNANGDVVRRLLAASAVRSADGKTVEEHVTDAALHLTGTEKGYLTSANAAGGVALLDASGNLPSSFIDTSKYPVELTVADIAARDALADLADGAKVFVEDASADALVDSGWAIYRYRAAKEAVGTEGEEGYVAAVEAGWTKVSEGESLDIVHDWGNIRNKPASAVADIDDAVAKRHEHANKADCLDKLSVADGKLKLDGGDVGETRAWVATVSDIPAEWPASVHPEGMLLLVPAGA